ncbi:MAG TPA: hypothetical protein DCY93_02985 [Firmicutes bacterium]|nr:hypothetical protein [Bacillota bacterium]
MLSVQARSSLTSRGLNAFVAWNGDGNPYYISAINLGSNSISKLEVVSALNSFNLARNQYHFYYSNCPGRNNPKVYLGAVQSAGINWNYDVQEGQKNLPDLLGLGGEKSGSWPQDFLRLKTCL